MPITLKVEAQADNRSFKQAADQATKIFSDAGKDASGSFAKTFGEGAKDVQKATSGYIQAYDSVADASGRANTAEKQRQQYLQKSEDLAKQAADAEKRLGAARDGGDTKAAATAEKDLLRIREQQARTDTQIVRSAEAVSSSRRKEQRDIREAVAAYRELENAQRRATAPGFARSFDSYSRNQGALSGVLSQSSGMVGQFSSLGSSSGKAFVGGAVAAILAGGLVAAGAKAAGLVVDGFKSVMDTGLDFSSTVNEFQGVTQSSAAQTSQMSAAARALGSDTTMAGVSASDAASAMTELAKAGFSVNEAIESARGTMQLATAASIDGASAAEIQANAINAFGLSAGDAARVADVLANAEVGSSAGITDIAQALQQVSGIARGFGEDINGTTAALMMLADAGIKGSDAGTLLKTTLQSITDQGNPAQAAIQELGLQLYSLNDQGQNQFVGFRELFRQLDEAKKRMNNPEWFQAQTNILFGTDAMRAAMLGSVEAYDTALAKTREFGTAADMAKAKMQGWPGVLEGIKNTVGELKLSLYDVFDTPTGHELGGKIVSSLDGLVKWVNTHKPEIVGFVSDFVSAWATGTDAFLTYIARMLQAGAFMQDGLSHTVGGVLEGVAKMAQGIGAVIKHIPGLGMVVGPKLESAGQMVDEMADKWQSLGGVMRSGADSVDQLREGIRGMRDNVTGSLGEIALAESRTRNYANAFDTLKDAVEIVPGTKEIVLTDNSPEVISKLESLGFAVQHLPNGLITVTVEYRDPSGRVVDPNQLGVSQRQLDDRNSRQHDWGITPPVAATPSGPAGPWTPSSARGGSSGGSGLPDAPVLPIAYTSTAGMSPELANAQNRVDETKHDLAEKQARLNQLMQGNVASENEIQKARNDVAKAEQDANGAQQRMQEAQISAYGKSAKQMDGMASAMGDIGASLDSDFGISKGLAGIAENITKFVANLAAAPLLGQLNAVSQANPSQGGHGIVGMLAAQGAFGPQYTGVDYSQQALGPAALQAGYAGSNPNVNAMMALAQQASGRVKYGPASDMVNGLADCSGSISDLVEMLQTGQTSPARLFDTTAFASDASAAKVGALPGTMPGALNVGVNPYPGQSGHMAATLPNGVNFEGGGATGGGAQYGNGAAGALDPQFEKRYYFPVAPQVASVGAPSMADIYSPVNTNPGLTNPPAPTTSGAWATNPATPPMLAGGPLGTGMPQSFLGGPSANTTRLGGVDAPAGPGGGGGIGIDSGGAIGMAMQAGGLALDAMAPGAGQAAQMGMKLINRTIEFGGQAVGIGAQGLIDTLLPFGGSELAQSNWATRLLGGLAGAAPALPNTAGKAAAAQPGADAGAQSQAAPQGNTYNANITNNQARDEGGNGRDALAVWKNQAPGN